MLISSSTKPAPGRLRPAGPAESPGPASRPPRATDSRAVARVPPAAGTAAGVHGKSATSPCQSAPRASSRCRRTGTPRRPAARPPGGNCPAARRAPPAGPRRACRPGQQLLRRLLLAGQVDRLFHRFAVHVHRVAHVVPAHVAERVVEDGEEPRLEVRAALELRGRTKRLQVGLLHQVLGILRAPGQPERRAVQAVDVGQRFGGEGVVAAAGAGLTAGRTTSAAASPGPGHRGASLASANGRRRKTIGKQLSGRPHRCNTGRRRFIPRNCTRRGGMPENGDGGVRALRTAAGRTRADLPTFQAVERGTGLAAPHGSGRPPERGFGRTARVAGDQDAAARRAELGPEHCDNRLSYSNIGD